MELAAWARDGSWFGAALPWLVSGGPLAVGVSLNGAPPFELWALLSAASVVGLVGGGVGGAALGAASARWPLAAWWLGLPAGLGTGGVAGLMLVVVLQASGRSVTDLATFTCGAVGASTAVLGPTHALYLAVRRRGRSGLVVLPLAGAFALVVGPVAGVGGVLAGNRLRELVLATNLLPPHLSWHL